MPYSYSYLFAYKIDLVPATQTIKLPDNPNVRILAISVADENPELKAAQPLYDVLPPQATTDNRDRSDKHRFEALRTRLCFPA